VSPGTLENARYRGGGLGLRYIKIGGKLVRYRTEDLDAFIASNAHLTTSDGTARG